MILVNSFMPNYFVLSDLIAVVQDTTNVLRSAELNFVQDYL
jgi:hypothetical protein